MDALRRLDAPDPATFGMAALAVKAGLEAAGAHERHLAGLIEDGAMAQTELEQLLEETQESR